MGIATPTSSSWIIPQGKASKQPGANNPKLWYPVNNSSPRLCFKTIFFYLPKFELFNFCSKEVSYKILVICSESTLSLWFPLIWEEYRLFKQSPAFSMLPFSSKSGEALDTHLYTSVSALLAVSTLCSAAAVPWPPASPGPAHGCYQNIPRHHAVMW